MHRIASLAATAALLVAACSGEAPPTDEETSTARTILVTGATGTQGGAVARELLDRGYRVRALTRRPEQPAATALAALGAKVVRGDFSDPPSLVAAMQGVSGVFAVTDFWEHGYETEIAHGDALIEAAMQAGVEHFVYSSVAGADRDTGLAHFDSKYEIEDLLEGSDLAYTILRPVEFMDNWRYRRNDLFAGRYADPRSPQDRHQWIAARDIGFFVGEAFDHPEEWLGRVEEIAGDELTLQELTSVMSDAFGRPVEYVRITYDDVEQASSPELADMYRWFAAAGYDVNIEALRSRYPELVTVREYLEGLAAGDDAP